MASAPATPSTPNAKSPLGGVAVALLIPRNENDEIDFTGYERQVHFLLQRGVSSFVLNGATGEYTRTTEAELQSLARLTRSLIGSRTLIVAIGSPSVTASRARASMAASEAADGLLLPMPYFFPYAQQDLASFVEAVLQGATLPVYLYNLPRFTSPLQAETCVSLLNQHPGLIGIKDSGGTTDILSAVREQTSNATCIVGSDSALHRALAAGVCDGVVSGVCCVLPELVTSFYAAAAADPASEQACQLNATLMEFIGWLDQFPVPWGLKVIAEARGLNTASFPMPLSADRAECRQRLLAWFQANRARLLATDDTVQL